MQNNNVRASTSQESGSMRRKSRPVIYKDGVILRSGSTFTGTTGISDGKKRPKENRPGLRSLLYGMRFKMYS